MKDKDDTNENWCQRINTVLRMKHEDRSYDDGVTNPVIGYDLQEKLNKMMPEERFAALKKFADETFQAMLTKLGRQDMIEAYCICLYLEARQRDRLAKI